MRPGPWLIFFPTSNRAALRVLIENPRDSPPGGARVRIFRPGAPAERAIEYIDANLGSTLRVDEIAKFVGLSASHFSRAFKVSRGLSPVTYISLMRVDRAKCMIRATRKTLCQIAGDCGFADQSHLSRSFRRWVGASPAAWRRLVRLPRLEPRR
jgi:AraC family transcriptional regulator